MSQTKTIWYSADSETRHPLDVFMRVNLADPIDGQRTAERCADDYHSNHDGWECSWPIEFALYNDDDDGPAVATFSVDRESVPHFTARSLR